MANMQNLNLKHLPGQSALSGIDLGESLNDAMDGSDAIRITDTGLLDKINLRCEVKSANVKKNIMQIFGTGLPENNRMCKIGRRSIIWLSPNEWLILSEKGTAGDIITTLDDDREEHIAVTNVSDAFGGIILEGKNIRAVLAKHCAIDLHPEVFTKGMAVQTLLSHASVIIACLESTSDKILVIGRSSFMPYIAELIADAALEFGYRYFSAE